MRVWRIFALGVLSLITTISAAQSATLVVENGQLIGARSINVNGTLLDVEFFGGSCIEVFDGCDDATDFFFDEFDELSFASAAAAALRDLVFIDTGAGPFDSAPELTRGCGSEVFCNIVIPFGGQAIGLETFAAVTLFNRDDDGADNTGAGQAFRGADALSFTLAKFSLAAPFTADPVPLPGAAILFAPALLAGWRLRRRFRSSV